MSTWTWTCSGATGEAISLPELDVPFPTQADAEAWLGESWMELTEAGATEVTLLRDGDVVYGPMSLEQG